MHFRIPYKLDDYSDSKLDSSISICKLRQAVGGGGWGGGVGDFI